jgi:hypothetical protein
MHVAYFHAGNAALNDPDEYVLIYDSLGTPHHCYRHEGRRPRFDFENVHFKQKVYPGILWRAGTELPTWESGAALFQCGNSADYHFWDCTWEWDLPSNWLSPSNHWSEISTVGYCAIYLHNCTRLPAALRPQNPATASDWPNVTFTEDSQTRGYKSLLWMRKLLPTDPLFYTLSDASFELSDPAWELEGSASILTYP